jgi:hypothetical protein
VQEFPESQYNRKGPREQLNIIGAPIPERGTPNPMSKASAAQFRGELDDERFRARLTLRSTKNGILISKDSKEGTDLIDEGVKSTTDSYR